MLLGVGGTATVTLQVFDIVGGAEDDSDSNTMLASVVDTTDPVVEITRPKDGEECPSAATQVQVRVSDNTATEVTVAMGARTLVLSAPDAQGWMQANMLLIKPKEEFEITAIAVDLGSNEGSDTVTTIKVHDLGKRGLGKD